jgi:hypothetical protein
MVAPVGAGFGALVATGSTRPTSNLQTGSSFD